MGSLGLCAATDEFQSAYSAGMQTKKHRRGFRSALGKIPWGQIIKDLWQAARFIAIDASCHQQRCSAEEYQFEWWILLLALIFLQDLVILDLVMI